MMPRSLARARRAGYFGLGDLGELGDLALAEAVQVVEPSYQAEAIV
jgi:hypothetical protein